MQTIDPENIIENISQVSSVYNQSESYRLVTFKFYSPDLVLSPIQRLH